MKYRGLSKQAFERAKVELSTNDPNRLKYAVLELRMAFEGMVYQKATNYTEELCGKKLNTWQPAKLLEILLEIDPLADQTYTLRVKTENKNGVKERASSELGTERVITLKEIKAHYHKLGSFLHMPTIEQIENNNGPTPQKITEECSKIIQILEEVFSSSIWNTNLRVTASMECKKCGEKVVRRIPPGNETVIANCINCTASYDLISKGESEVHWVPREVKLQCANPGCDMEIWFWENDLDLGHKWYCPKCKGENLLTPGIRFTPSKENEKT